MVMSNGMRLSLMKEIHADRLQTQKAFALYYVLSRRFWGNRLGFAGVGVVWMVSSRVLGEHYARVAFKPFKVNLTVL